MNSMAGASKLNTSHQHHCYGRNPWFNKQLSLRATAGVALFSLSFSLYLYFSLFIFLFFCCCSLIYGQKFLFLLPAYLWIWDFGFFLGFNDLEKERILVWVWGCEKERIFVSSFRCSKGWIFGLVVAMFLH